jgi:hypothetical protein
VPTDGLVLSSADFWEYCPWADDLSGRKRVFSRQPIVCSGETGLVGVRHCQIPLWLSVLAINSWISASVKKEKWPMIWSVHFRFIDQRNRTNYQQMCKHVNQIKSEKEKELLPVWMSSIKKWDKQTKNTFIIWFLSKVGQRTNSYSWLNFVNQKRERTN